VQFKLSTRQFHVLFKNFNLLFSRFWHVLHTGATEWNYGVILCEGESVYRKYRLPDKRYCRYIGSLICGRWILWYIAFLRIYLYGHYEGLCWSCDMVFHHSVSVSTVRRNIFCLRLCDEYNLARDGCLNKKWWQPREKLLSIRCLWMCCYHCCIFHHYMLFIF